MMGGFRVAFVTAGTAAVVSIAEWIHQLAGVFGDVGVIAGGAGLTYSLFRQLRQRVWLPTRYAWERIDHAADGVDELRAEVTRRFDDGTRRFEALESQIQDLTGR